MGARGVTGVQVSEVREKDVVVIFYGEHTRCVHACDEIIGSGVGAR